MKDRDSLLGLAAVVFMVAFIVSIVMSRVHVSRMEDSLERCIKVNRTLVDRAGRVR